MLKLRVGRPGVLCPVGVRGLFRGDTLLFGRVLEFAVRNHLAARNLYAKTLEQPGGDQR